MTRQGPELAIQETALLRRDLTPRQLIVLAAKLAHEQRDESAVQLAARLPFHEGEIRDELRWLEAHGYFRTKKARWNPKVRIITHVDPRYDNRAGTGFVFMPGWFLDKTIGAKPRSATTRILVGLLLIRQQQLRKAIHVYPSAVCNDLGITAKLFLQAIRDLRATGLLHHVDDIDGLPVYVLPGVKHAPIDLEYLDPSKTRRDSTFSSSAHSPPTKCPLTPDEVPTHPRPLYPYPDSEERPSNESLRDSLLDSELRSLVAEETAAEKDVRAVQPPSQDDAADGRAAGKREVEEARVRELTAAYAAAPMPSERIDPAELRRRYGAEDDPPF
jgi:hypothetical protein